MKTLKHVILFLLLAAGLLLLLCESDRLHLLLLSKFIGAAVLLATKLLWKRWKMDEDWLVKKLTDEEI